MIGNLSVADRRPRRRDWARRLDDPDEPLYTIAVVAELLDVDQQIVRRLEGEGSVDRPAPTATSAVLPP